MDSSRDDETSRVVSSIDLPICDSDRKAVDFVLGWEIVRSLKNLFGKRETVAFELREEGSRARSSASILRVVQVLTQVDLPVLLFFASVS